MKFSNFNLVEVIGGSPIYWKFRATVDVTSGFFRKKTVTRDIFKSYAGSWSFVDSGEFCPDEVDNLERSYRTKLGKDLEHCLSSNVEGKEYKEYKERKEGGKEAYESISRC